MGRNWRRDLERKMVTRGYETVHGSSQEVAGLMRAAGCAPARRGAPLCVDDTAALIEQFLANGGRIKRLPMKKGQ